MQDDRENLRFPDPSKTTKGVLPPRYDKALSYFIDGSGEIQSYKYTKMAPMSNMRSLVSRVISGFNDVKGNFMRVANIGAIENTKASYKELFSDFPAETREPLFVINNDKIENRNVIEYHALEPTSPASKTIRSALVYNDALQMRTYGYVTRRPGIFVDVSSETDTQGIWEDIFLGSWLVTHVVHTVTTTDYVNDILAVKPNMSDSFKYPTDKDGLHEGAL